MITFIIAFILFSFWHALGVTLGYHRIMTHKAAECNKILFYFLIAGGYLCLMGAPLSWAQVHRYHHQVSDTPRDPHTPKRGFWYAFNGWIWTNEGGQAINRDYLVKDLLKDKLLKFFGRGQLPSKAFLNASCCIAWRLVLYYFFGLEVAIASLLAGVYVFILPQLINTFCHTPKLGYRNYETTDLSTNVPWLAFFTLGESFHNNHHYKPNRLAQGEPWELDITYQAARLFRFLGLMKF